MSVQSKELPLPFSIPLPWECSIPGSTSRSYNQGKCSMNPCRTEHGPCSESSSCCYEVGQTSSVEFLCASPSSPIHGVTVDTCTCQLCDKLKTHIKGRVMSSQDRKPIVLAVIMTGSEVATLTNSNGFFSFELLASTREVSLLFQESQHRSVEVNLDVLHSNTLELSVVLEHIDVVQLLDKVHLGFSVELTHPNVPVDPDVHATIQILPNSLVSRHTQEVYTGSGQLLYSLYSSRNKPDFTSEALKQMVYTDSKGVGFTIQSYVICSMEMVDENGYPLELRSKIPLSLKLTIRFERTIDDLDVSNLHLFIYSKVKGCWMDNGRVGIVSIKKHEGEYGTFVTIQQTMREISQLWAIGFPVRVTCYVKALVMDPSSGQELPGATLSLEQTDNTLNRPTYYQYSEATSQRGGSCLGAACSLGGIIQSSVSSVEGTQYKLAAVTPNMDYGITVGNTEQIMFYFTEPQTLKANTVSPFYPTKEACHSGTTFFTFISQPEKSLSLPPPILLPDQQEDIFQDLFCFVKVAVYDCAPYTEIKVLSFSSTDHKKVLSMNYEVAVGQSSQDKTTCLSSSVAGIRASCVQFTCGSDIHISAQSRDNMVDSSDASLGNLVDCRYWSSNSASKANSHVSQTMFSYHLADDDSYGVYRSSSKTLALLKCKSGKEDEPENKINNDVGSAVTFTCLY